MDLDVGLVGERLRQLRELRALTLTTVAAQAGVAKSYLAKLERGEVENPGVATLNAVAGALDVRLGELFAPATGSHKRKWSTVVDPLEVERLKANLPPGLEEFLLELEAEERGPVTADVLRSLALMQIRGKRPVERRDWRFVYEAMLRSVK
jgi:transcriptional regulator with XRE-family HTH domain